MTLGDLFEGRRTWAALLSIVWPILLVAVSAFYAGYWRGRNVELRLSVERLRSYSESYSKVIHAYQKANSR